jgi:DNA-binding LytR/AlgR family response regulator
MKAIAVDDEPIALEVVRSLTDKVPFIELTASFTNAFTALAYLQKEDVDLIFLDIKMPDISGIEFLQTLQKKPLVIFTTAYSEHAVTSFELDAVDYLLKPFSLARFVKACNKAFELFQFRNAGSAADHIFLKTGNEQQKVLFDDILYLEASGNYVTFVVKERSILVRMTFSEVADLLPPNRFLRAHRSYIVSVNKIDKVERHQLTIASKKIPVSEGYLDEITSRLKKLPS